MSDESPSPEQEPGEGRLSRWSRLKLQQQQQQQQRDQSQIEQSTEQSSSEPLVAAAEGDPQEPEQDVLVDADMPPIESLGANSDFSGFLSPGVSEELRKLALRKLFALPSFKVRDGLDDYDDDFTVFEPLGDTVTNDPWTHRQKRLAEEREAAEAERRRLDSESADDADSSAEDPEAEAIEAHSADPEDAEDAATPSGEAAAGADSGATDPSSAARSPHDNATSAQPEPPTHER